MKAGDRVVITGSEGLVGRYLRSALAARGVAVAGLDVLGAGGEKGDVRDACRVAAALAGCHGVVHLAAVSRVVWGERDPQRCRDTNVGGVRNVIEAVERQPHPPWLIFASSREVYGQPERLPAVEDAPLRPVNVYYGRSKVEGERMVREAQRRGLRAATVRLSNVYGATEDHVDRVVPAFARAAVLGNPLRVDGAGHTFDFTHIDDTTRGIVGLADLLANGQGAPPPIQLLTGRPTSLGELAALAVQVAGVRAPVRSAPPRPYDVSHFCGSPARARMLLGWAPRVGLREGLERLIGDFRHEIGASRRARTASGIAPPALHR